MIIKEAARAAGRSVSIDYTYIHTQSRSTKKQGMPWGGRTLSIVSSGNSRFGSCLQVSVEANSAGCRRLVRLQGCTGGCTTDVRSARETVVIVLECEGRACRCGGRICPLHGVCARAVWPLPEASLRLSAVQGPEVVQRGQEQGKHTGHMVMWTGNRTYSTL